MDGRHESRRCTEKKLTLEYPKHRFTPEDLLHFIESTEFTGTWAVMGLDDEEDLESLQLCIMANPKGDLIPGTGGLRKHDHAFGEWADDKGEITVYYGYFEDYGIVYLVCVEESGGDLAFSQEERGAIRESLVKVKRELDRLKTIR